MRRAAHGVPSDVELIRSRRMLVDRMPVHMAAECRAVLTVVNRHRGILAHLPLRTDANDTREPGIVIDIVALAVRMFRMVIFTSRRAEIPQRDPDIRRKRMFCLEEDRLVDGRDTVGFENGALNFDDKSRIFPESITRHQTAVLCRLYTLTDCREILFYCSGEVIRGNRIRKFVFKVVVVQSVVNIIIRVCNLNIGSAWMLIQLNDFLQHFIETSLVSCPPLL